MVLGDTEENVSASARSGKTGASLSTSTSTNTSSDEATTWNGLERPEVVAIMAIYFVQGALGLARLATAFFLKDELHLGTSLHTL